MALRCVLLLAVTAGAFAGPVTYYRDSESSSTCATTCPEPTKFSFETGKTYEYQYESDVKTHLSGASEEHSSLHVRATALIEVLAPCEMALRLSDVSLQDSTPSQYDSRQHVDQSWEFKKALQEFPMRFAFIDGKVESVCAVSGDDTWVLNIKKGIVSAFQNTQTSLSAKKVTVESDVAGECPVEYEVEGSSWGTTTIKKTKDLLGCTERVGVISAFQSTPYRVESAIQSLPLMKSTHQCTQKFKDGILKESSCTELHVFRPFSRHEKGAATEVSYKLTYDKTNNGVSTQQGGVKRSSLLFEHELSKVDLIQDTREVQQTLDKLCRKSQDDVAPEVPRLFMQLVRQMRQLDTRTLSQFHRSSASTCTKASKFINNAIPLLGSTASVSLIRDLITDGQVSEEQTDTWLTSLSFIAEPTKELLREAKPLLTMPAILKKSALSVSTLVHSFCRSNDNCESETEVSDIIRILEDNLHYNCKAETPEQHQIILMSLKGLGNTGRATQAVPTLNRCFLNEELDAEMRITALQAFRRMACDADMTEAINLLANAMEDSEIRINAYLAAMHCPTPAILERIEQILANEEVNQVGSFIWTHLTNLLETANPHKQGIRAILSNESLKKSFDLDKRKFSRNLEWSMFSQLINAGAMTETNLIWSENSFVPRSASLNLTVDVFGESVNLLELGGRLQGVEKTLERLFAKQDNNVEQPTGLLTDLDNTYDLKRDDPQASYYVRVFGNEIRYDDVHNFDLAGLKDKLNYLDWLIELSKEHNFELTKNQMFLDATMQVPTAAGLPLKLTVDGASTINIKVNGKLDIRQMFSSSSTFDINGIVAPSASVEINGEMGVDAHVARTGLKMQTILHSSTVSEGKIQMQDGKIFNLDVKAPQDNTEIISANNKFYIVYRDEEREQRMITDDRIEKNECTSAKFAKITGLELCGQLSLPLANNKENAPWFPLWGPASGKVVINKKDSHDKYLAEIKYVKEKARRNGVIAITDVARFYVNTPGSRINRELLVEATVDRSERQMTFNLDTPWKKATFEAGLTNSDELKLAFAKAMLDGSQEYSVSGEVQIDEKSYRVDYVPKFELVIPGMDKIVFSGDIKYRPGKKGVFTMALKNAFKEPVKASGSIMAVNEPNQMRYETEVEFSSELLNGKLATFVDNTKDQTNTVSSKFDLEYVYANQPQQTVHFDKTFVDNSQGKTLSLVVDSTWSTSLAPQYGGDLHFDYTLNPKTLNINLNAGLDQQRRIIYGETAAFEYNDFYRFDMDSRIQFPYKNIDIASRVNYLHNADEFTTTLYTKYAENKEATGEVSIKGMTSQPLNILTQGKLQYPGRDMSLVNRIQERAVKEFHQNLNIQLEKYQNIEINSVYKMDPRHEVTSKINIPDVPEITLKGYLRPDPKNVQAHAEVTYDGRQYLTETNWRHQGNSKNFNTQADMEVTYPGKSVTVQATTRRVDSEVTSSLETKWDAGRDESKKFTLNSKVTIEPTTPGLELEVTLYPNHFVNMNVNGKYETSGWYKSSSDVEGSLGFRSSFRNFEDISASFTHDRTTKAYKNLAEVSWKPNQKITGKLNLKNKDGWSDVESVLELTTPFQGYRTISSEVSHKLSSPRFEGNAKIQMENQRITLGVDSSIDIPRRSLSGVVTFTSPFRKYEDLSASFEHNDDGSSILNKLDATWARNKKISSEANIRYVISGAAATVNGEVAITTPFDVMKEEKIIWQHEHNTQKVKNVVQLEHEGQSIYNHNLDSNIKKTNKKMVVDVKASMKAQNLDEISIMVDHSHENDKMKSEASVQWAPSKTVTYSHDLKYDASTLFGAKVKFISPFEGFENINFNSNTNDERGKIISANELKWGTNQKMTLQSEMTLRGYELQKQIRFTSPFQGIQQVSLGITNQKQDGIWVSHMDLDYGKRIDIDTQVSTGYKKVAGIAIKSPCPYLKNVALSAEMNGEVRNFRYNVEASHEQLADKITWTGIVNTENVNDIKVTSNLKTPFDEVRFLRGALNHKMEGESIHCDANIEHPQYKGSFTHDTSYKRWRSLTTNTVVEYIEGQKIEINADIKMKPKVTGKIQWKSPFENVEDLSMTFDHEGTSQSFATRAEVMYTPRDKITADVNFNLVGNTLAGNAKLTTPFQEARRVMLTINHDGPMMGFKNDATFELNEMTVSGKSEFNLQGTNLVLKGEIQSPLKGYETMTIEVTHNGALDRFTNNAVISIGSTQVSGSTEMRVRQASLNGNLVLNLPLDALKKLTIDVDHSGPWTNLNNKVVVTYDGKKILSKGSFVMNGNNVEGKIVVKTPFANAKTISAEINHAGPATNFQNSAVVSVNNKEGSASSEFKLVGNTLGLKAALNLPIETVKALSIEVNHEGPIENFNNNALVTYNNEQVSGSSQFRLTGANHVTAKASLAAPEVTASFDLTHQGPIHDFNNNWSVKYNEHQAIGSSKVVVGSTLLDLQMNMEFLKRVMSLNMNHNGPLTDFNNNFVFTYNGEESRGSSEFRLNGNTLAAKADIACPKTSIAAEVNHNGPATAFNNNFVITYKGKEARGSSEFQLEGNTLAAKATIRCPGKTMSAEVNHNGPMSNFNNDATFKYGNKEVSGSSRFTLAGNNLNTHITFVCPGSTLTATVEHTGPISDFKNSANIGYNGKEVSGSTEFTTSKNRMSGKATLNIPENTMSLEVNHRGKVTNFNNDVTMVYNDMTASGNSKFRLNGNTVTAEGALNLPDNAMSFDVSHEGPKENFKNSLTAIYNRKQVRGSSELAVSGNSLTGKASLRLPSKQLKSLELEISHNGPAHNFNNNLMLKYNNKQVSGNSKLTLADNTLEASAMLEMPSHHLSAELNHNGPAQNFNNNVMLKYNDKQVNGNSKLRLSGNSLEATTLIEIPSHRVSAELNHNGPAQNFNNNIKVVYNDVNVNGNSKLTFSGNNLEASAMIRMPSKRLSAELKHNGPATNFANSASMSYNGKSVNGNSEFNLNGNNLRATVALTCPSNSMSAELSHNGPLKNFNNHGVFTFNGKQVDGSSMFTLKKNGLTGKATLNIPSNNMMVEVTHNGMATDFTTDATAAYNGKEVNGNVQFALQGTSLKTKATLALPNADVRTVAMEVNHEGTADNFKNDASLKYGDKEISGSCQFKLRNTKLNVKADLNMPCEHLPKIALEVSHNGPVTQFRNNAALTIAAENIRGGSEFTLAGNEVSGKANLDTSYEMKPLSVEFSHSGPKNNFNNNAAFKYGNHEVSGRSEFSLGGNSLDIKLNLDTTIQNVKPVSLTINHAGPAENFKNSAIATYGSSQISGNTEFSLRGTSLSAKANMDTTLGNVKPIAIEITHDGPETSFANKAVVRYGRKMMTATSEYRSQANSIEINANMQTTFAAVEPLSIALRHDGPLKNFNNNGQVQYGRYEIKAANEFHLNGNIVHLKSSMETNIGDVKPVSIEINHEGPMMNFNNNAIAKYGDDNISGSSQFSLRDTAMHIKATLESSLRSIKPMSVELTHNGPLEKFDDAITLNYGNKEISSDIQFSIEGNTMTGALKLQTPFAEVEKLMAKFTHNGKNWRNFENSGAVRVNNAKYTGQSEFRWFGKIFKMSAEVNTPDEYSIKINHKGFSDDFSNNMKIKFPGEKISGTSSFKMENNKMEGRANMDSTLKSLNALDLSFDHEGDAGNFKSAFDIKTPFKGYKKFNGEVSHEGTLQNFQCTAKLGLPFSKVKSLGASVSKQGNSDQFNTGASVSYNDKTITGNVNYKNTGRKIESNAELTTPYSGYENFGASLEHSGEANNFQSRGVFTSSIPRYERFEGSLSHNAGRNNVKTTGQITTPIPGYNNFGFDVEHAGPINDFKTSATATSSLRGYEKFGASVEHKLDGRTLRTVGSVQTPFSGFEEFAASLDHTGAAKNFETALGITTPIRKYKNFGLKVNHNGNDDEFRTAVEATSSVRGYDKFGASIEKSGNLRNFEVSGQIQTPYENYRSQGFKLNHRGHLNDFSTNAEATSSVAGYERFAAKLNHNGDAQRFTTNAEVETPITGHERYALNIDHSALNNVETTATLEYPGKKYDLSLNHQGSLKNFNTDLNIRTPHRGYEQFGLTMNHNGDLQKFTSGVAVRTPIAGHERYALNVDHDFSSNLQTSASLECPGKKYDFNLNHEGNLRNFNTDVSLTTPHPGYESFGLTMSHNGAMNDFTQRGTIRLPFRDLQEIVYSVSHRGGLNDFACSAEVEFQGQKIEAQSTYKKTSSWSESNYDAGLTVSSTYSQLRDLQIVASHNGKDNQKKGALDITHNGVKKVDMDYEYTTSGAQSISLKVRQPRPFETTINFNGDSKQFSGDAMFNWKNQQRLSAQLNLKNNDNDKEVSVQMTLPTRTVSVVSGYTATPTTFSHKTDLQWDSAADKKLSYSLEMSKTSRRSQNIIDGKFTIQSSKVNGEATFNHVCVPGSQYTTELAVQTTSRMAIKSEITFNGPKYQHKITLEHPELRRGASVNVEGTLTDKLFENKVDFQYNRETFTITTRAADESSYSGERCVHSLALAHPNSQLDYQFTSIYEDNSEETSYFQEHRYLMARDGQTKVGSLRTQLNKLRKEISMEVITPADTLRMSGRQVSASNGVYQYTAEASCDHKSVSGELSINQGRSLDLTLHGTDNSVIEVSASGSIDMLKAEVSHTVSGTKTKDVVLMIKKGSDRMITSKDFIRPNLMKDAMKAWTSSKVCRVWKNALDQLADAVEDEFNRKIEYVKANARPFYRALVSIKDDVVATYEGVKAELIDMYQANEFHIKEIYEWIVNAVEWSRNKYTELSQQAKANYTKAKAASARATSSLEEWYNRAWEYSQDASEQFASWWEDMPEYSDVRARFETQARDLADRVQSHETFKKFMSRVRTMQQETTGYFQGEAVATTGSRPSLYDKIMRRDEVQAGIEYMTSRVKNSEIASKYFNIKQTIDNIVDDIHKHGLKTIRTNVVAWFKDWLKTDEDSFKMGDGNLEFTLYVPLPLDDLLTVPKVDVDMKSYITKAKRMIDLYYPKYDWTFWDYYYNYKPSSNFKDMIPPFKAHATIAGSQHYMTFDKHFYEFAGECSYLLARDFIDGTFSVIANYENVDNRQVKRSLTVISNDKTIEIFPEGHVIMDNSRVEMPVFLDGTKIVRDISMIRVENKNGVNVICDLPHDRCTVEVTGWYFGKTAGLLGTYNNEAVDDLTTADHRRVENIGEFAASWAVGQRCRPVNAAIDVSNEVTPSSRRYDICAKYFEEESSPFRRCFKVVDPAPFMKACMNTRPADNHMDTEQDSCNAASFYVSECNKYEVPLNIPNMCVQCQLENGQTFTEGQNVTISGDDIPNTADIVFVIHQSECNRMMLDNLKSMVDDMEKVFKTENLRGNRYSLVGYGGIESEPHIHTMNGQIFETRDKILLGLENFNTVSGEKEDAMSAVKYAANLPFRAGVSKNIILLPCASCRQGETKFSELQQILLFRDINFHVMMQYNFLFKGNKDAGTAFIFGVDRETVYTRKDAGTTELVGDADLRSQILMPKDLCVALSEETDGSVFNTLMYINSRPFIQKRFMDVLVRVIADKAEPSDCQVCDCVPDNVGAGKADCRSCVRPSPIYNLMPHYHNAPVLPQLPQVIEPSKQTTVKKPKTKKTKKEINAKKRAMREARLRRQRAKQQS